MFYKIKLSANQLSALVDAYFVKHGPRRLRVVAGKTATYLDDERTRAALDRKRLLDEHGNLTDAGHHAAQMHLALEANAQQRSRRRG